MNKSYGAEIKDTVKQTLSELLCIPEHEIQPTSSLKDDLGLDSFGAVELIHALQEAFGSSLSPDAGLLVKIRTVHDLEDFLGKLI